MKGIWRRIDRFFLGLAVGLDSFTAELCRATGQPIPPGVRRRWRKWTSKEAS